jgi:hypothetical protein
MLRSKSDATAKARNHKQPWAGLPLYTALAIGGAACFGSGASAQDWIPNRCCPNTDCQQNGSASVAEVRGGYVVEGVEGVVPYEDPRVQHSQDGQFHACIRSQARPNMSHTAAMVAGEKKELKCLFVPLMG